MDGSEWTGRVGDIWADEWRRTDRSFAALDPALERAILAWAPSGAARLVDLGCGAGTTSLAVVAAQPDAELVGLDLSPALVAVAEARRQEATLDPARCRFLVGDSVAAVAGVAPVDLFFSRHGVMFFADPEAAFRAFAAATAPGGAIVFSCFAATADNRWATEPTGDDGGSPPITAPPAPGPFAFADPARVAAILAAAGWRALPPERICFRYVAGAGPDPIGDAVDFFRRIGPAARTLRNAAEEERPALLARLADACARRLEAGEVAFPAAAWLWTAVKESQ